MQLVFFRVGYYYEMIDGYELVVGLETKAWFGTRELKDGWKWTETDGGWSFGNGGDLYVTKMARQSGSMMMDL